MFNTLDIKADVLGDAWLALLAQRKQLAWAPEGEMRDKAGQLLSAEEDLLCAVFEWLKLLDQVLENVGVRPAAPQGLPAVSAMQRVP